jgi:hypothetical protein
VKAVALAALPHPSARHSGHAQRQAAGERCLQLSVENLCSIFGQPERPAVCSGFPADVEVCGSSSEEAIKLIGWWEQMTAA